MLEKSPLFLAFRCLAWLAVLGMLATTYGWQYHHDTPLLNFAATMMVEQGWLPYRDIFETTMPATFLFHYAIVAFGLEGNLPFILVGIATLILLGGLGALILAPLTRTGAWVFAPFYVALMLSFGPHSLLQREVLGLVPLALSLWLATRTTLENHSRQQGIIGLLFGIACLIKPQFALGAPIVVMTAAAMANGQNALMIALKGILISVASFTIPLALTAIAMWASGALPRFIFILTEYTPLYIQQTGTHEFIAPELRGQYLWDNMFHFGSLWPLLPGFAMLVLLLAIKYKQIDRRPRIILTAVIALCITYGLVPIASGQFWPYHYYTFGFFCLLGICGVFVFLNEALLSRAHALACLGLIALTFATQAPRFFAYEYIERNADNRAALAHDMQVALIRWLPEGARVQPLDWTSGALHAMMLTRNQLATQFMYNFHFAHHVSHPVIKGLRAELMTELSANPPEGLLVGLKPARVHGLDVSYEFPELDAFRDAHYLLVEEDENFQLFRRRDLGS